MKVSDRARVLLASALLLGACGERKPHDIGRQTAALIGGAPTDPTQLGLIQLHTNAGDCSAALLTNNWAIAARHCFCDDEEGGPSSVSFEMNGQTLGVRAINLGTADDNGKQLDLSLMATDGLFPLAQPISIFDGAPSDLVGQDLTCYGYGSGPRAIEVAVDQTISDVPAPQIATCNATPESIDGVEVVLPEDAAFEAPDMGGPCFVTRNDRPMLAGIIAATASDDERVAYVQTLEQLLGFIRDNSSIWSAAACAAPIADSAFAMDPQIFMGVVAPFALITVAANAFDTADDPRTLIGYNVGFRFGPWVRTAPPALAKGLRGLGASADPDGVGTGDNLLEITYIDDAHELHAFWDKHAPDGTWVQRDKLEQGEPFLPFDGHGPRISQERLHAPPDLSVRVPLFVTSDGRVAASRYLDSTRGWVDMFLPASAPLADARKRPTLIMHAGNGDLVAGYRDLKGRFIVHRGSILLLDEPGATTVWYDTPSIVTDIPADMREVSLGVTTQRSDRYWVVTVAHDDSMALWSLDLTTGHATFFSSISGTSIGGVKTMPFAFLLPFEELFISYTGRDWAAHVRPAVNCLGNTPPGWE